MAVANTSIKNQIIRNLDELKSDLLQINTFIHSNPELGNQEFKAQALLTEILQKHGFKVITGVADLHTAFVAEIEGEGKGPTIAFIAEYDALPEIGHGCGHNIIAASALGAAIALAPIMKGVKGKIKVIGTPAEDTTSEKVHMIKKGVFEDVDFSMQCHPNDRTMTGAHFKALHKMNMHFHGKASHASRAPEKGISALDALMLTFMGIEFLREHVKKDVTISGIITHGGTAANSIPDFAAGRFSIRSENREYLKEVVERVYNCARGAALATGAKLEFKDQITLDNMLYLPTYDKLLLDNALILNPPQVLQQSTVASSDFCNVSTILPCSRLDIAYVPVGVSTHSQEFADAGTTDYAHKAITISSFAMAATALDIFLDSSLAAQIKKEHAQALGSRHNIGFPKP